MIGGHLSHTTQSPSPPFALGTIQLGNPLPPPLLPCMRVSPVAGAASQELYVLAAGVAVDGTDVAVGRAWRTGCIRPLPTLAGLSCQ